MGSPQRTCLGCGARKSKTDLVRLVAREGRLVVDRPQREPGRGGYCCATAACANRLLRVKDERLRRLFRSSQRLSLEGVPEEFHRLASETG